MRMPTPCRQAPEATSSAIHPGRRMLRAFYKDTVRYQKEYWDMYWQIRPGTYLAGDKATKDKDGYFTIQGRIDDVLKVAGHRLSNAEVESALVGHPKVAEAAVIGKPDEVKGEVIVAFVTLRTGNQESDELEEGAGQACEDSPGTGSLAQRRSTSSTMCPRPGPARSCAVSSRPRLWATPPAISPLWPTQMQ